MWLSSSPLTMVSLRLLVLVVVAIVMVFVDDRVSPSPGDEVAVHRVCRHERHRQREGQATPKQEAAQTGLHRPRHDEHHRAVDDLQDGYRGAARGEGHGPR